MAQPNDLHVTVHFRSATADEASRFAADGDVHIPAASRGRCHVSGATVWSAVVVTYVNSGTSHLLVSYVLPCREVLKSVDRE